MSRASRTAEILAAAGLVPLQLEQERIRAGRDAARSSALASLLPALIQTGAGIAGDVAQRDMAERKFAADLEARKARDAAIIEARNARTGVDATKAAADLARANAKAEADRVKGALEARTTNIAGAASDTESLISRPGGVSQAELERIAVARGLPASDWRTVLGARDTAVDETAALAAKNRQGEATAKLAERKAEAPIGKAPPTAQQIADAEDKRLLTKLSIKEKQQVLSGEKPLAPSEDERKVQNNVDSMTKNVGKLMNDLGAVDDGGFGPGLVSGPLREGFAKVFGDEAWTNFASTRDAVNLQIFGTLRSDAPSEGENKAAAGLRIDKDDNLDSIKSKVRTIRALLDAKRRNPGSRLDVLIAGLRGTPETTATPAAAPPSFGSFPDVGSPPSFDSLPDAD
jgi:hypothetical protein